MIVARIQTLQILLPRASRIEFFLLVRRQTSFSSFYLKKKKGVTALKFSKLESLKL